MIRFQALPRRALPPLAAFLAALAAISCGGPPGSFPGAAVIASASGLPVTWTIREGSSGGAVTADGLYTAPAAVGTYHIDVASAADPTRYGTAAVTVGGAASGAPVLWAAPALARVGPDASAGGMATAAISAARGEAESFQVIVKAPASGLTGVDVTASSLTGPGGATIPAANMELYRERYITLTAAMTSPDQGGAVRPLGPGTYPDGLIPFLTAAGVPNASAAPFSLAAGKNQPIWIDVRVPRGIPAGTYTGRVTVTSDQGRGVVPVSVRVWNFDLPLQPALKTAIGLSGATRGSLAYFTILAQHRLAPTYQQDASPSVAAPQLERLYGTRSVFLPVYDHRAQGGNDGCTLDPAPSAAALRAWIASYPAGYAKYQWITDEPQYGCTNMAQLYDHIRRWAAAIHQTSARALLTLEPVAALLDDGSGSGRTAVDTWVMVPRRFDPTDPAYLTARSKGNEFWHYYTVAADTYSPKWQLDYAPVNYRVGGFINQSLGFTGILYWSANYPYPDPWNNPVYSTTDCVLQPSTCHFPGEALLIYPGEPVGTTGPVPSMRLKWIRDAVDDFDYVELLKGAGAADFALQVARTVGRDFRTWSQDPAAVESARAQLGKELDRLAPPP